MRRREREEEEDDDDEMGQRILVQELGFSSFRTIGSRATKPIFLVSLLLLLGNQCICFFFHFFLT